MMGVIQYGSTSEMTAASDGLSSSHKPADQHQQRSRIRRICSTVTQGVVEFFGVGDGKSHVSRQWQNRRLKHALRLFGKVKDGIIPMSDDYGPDSLSAVYENEPEYSTISNNGVRGGSMASTRLHSVRTGSASQTQSKASVMSMTWKGLKHVLGAQNYMKQKAQIHSQSRRTITPITNKAPVDVDASDGPSSFRTTPYDDEPYIYLDDVFFDEVPKPDVSPPKDPVSTHSEKPTAWRRKPNAWLLESAPPQYELSAPDGFGMQRMQRIEEKFLQSSPDISSREYIGRSGAGRWMTRRSQRNKAASMADINDSDDHRPYFTYWVTFVQLVIFIVSISVYGVSHIGYSETIITSQVMKPNLVIENAQNIELDNLWVGPSQPALIHLGAKYSPCMRRDTNIYKAIDQDRAFERQSGCCILNDGSGCYQTIENHCSVLLATFVKSSKSSTRYRGVCGQDPLYCKTPASVAPFQWSEDITQWPLCTDTVASAQAAHMQCTITGHPCCFGIQGECMITTREHCTLKQGYYHDTKYLCSQASCLSQICGMIGFTDDQVPDQFYRLWTSLFLHGGTFHLIITLLFQIFIMHGLEKLAGVIRISIIYIASGIVGNIASSIFIPYQVEIGPAGSQFGILACLLIEIIQTWRHLVRPWIAFLLVGGCILILFLLGLLPWIDNYAHLFGFVIGVLLSLALMPYLSFGITVHRRPVIGIILSLSLAVGIFLLLVVLFYVLPIYECQYCQYFNCVPFTKDFCRNMEIVVRQPSYLDVWKTN